MYTTYIALDALSEFRCRASIADGETDLAGLWIGLDAPQGYLEIDDPEGDVECVQGNDRIVVRGATLEQVANALFASWEGMGRWEIEMAELAATGTPRDILDSLTLKIGCPSMIIDFRNIRSALADFEHESFIPEWEYARSYGRLSWEMFDRIERDMVFQSKMLSAQDKPFSASICADGREAIACRIRPDDAPAMLLLAFDGGRGISPGMVQMASVAADAIRRWISIHPGELGAFSMMDTLSRLASGEDVPEDVVVAERRRMAPDGAQFVLMKIVCDSFRGNAHAAAIFQAKVESSRCFELGNNLYALCVDKPGLEELIADIAKRNGMRFGLSWKFSDWSIIAEAVNQTEVALSNSAGNVAVLDPHCVLFYIFSILVSSTSNIEIIHPAIPKLERYDEEHGSEYMRTLWVYLRHERNLVSTAEDLGIHRNSLVYRVRRIGEILPDVDLDDPETREHLMISYRISGLRERTSEDGER